MLKKHLLLFFAVAIAAAWTFAALRPQYSSSGPALDVWALNVGQGESVLVREPGGKKLLFDGGPDDSVLNELGDVLPVWDRSIDLVILSHNHSDHVRGLISVLQRYSVGEVWMAGAQYNSNDYRQFLKELKEDKLDPKISFFDQDTCTPTVCPAETPFGALELQIYHPMQNMEGKVVKDQHDATLSVKVTYGNRSVFLTGDLNEGHEEAMLHACRAPCTLAADILQVPHHGSLTGLSPGFLKAVDPKAAFIPVGLDNSYGHPGDATLQKLERAHVPTYRTDTEGRIHFRLDQNGYSVETES